MAQSTLSKKLSSKDDWKKIQERTFTNWFNDRLRGHLKVAKVQVGFLLSNYITCSYKFIFRFKALKLIYKVEYCLSNCSINLLPQGQLVSITKILVKSFKKWKTLDWPCSLFILRKSNLSISVSNHSIKMFFYYNANSFP